MQSFMCKARFTICFFCSELLLKSIPTAFFSNLWLHLELTFWNPRRFTINWANLTIQIKVTTIISKNFVLISSPFLNYVDYFTSDKWDLEPQYLTALGFEFGHMEIFTKDIGKIIVVLGQADISVLMENTLT